MKYTKYIREHFNDAKSPVISMQELKTVLRLRGISDPYLKRLINYLMKRGELRRISRGFYTFHDDITVVGFAFRPFYYGLENALTIRKIWEQGTNPVILTTRSVRNGLRKFDGGNYIVQKIRREHFFGYGLVRYYNFWIPVSDPEKTLIDLLYYGHGIQKDALEPLLNTVDKNKLEKYLKHYDKNLRNSVRALVITHKLSRKAKVKNFDSTSFIRKNRNNNR